MRPVLSCFMKAEATLELWTHMCNMYIYIYIYTQLYTELYIIMIVCIRLILSKFVCKRFLRAQVHPFGMFTKVLAKGLGQNFAQRDGIFSYIIATNRSGMGNSTKKSSFGMTIHSISTPKIPCIDS